MIGSAAIGLALVAATRGGPELWAVLRSRRRVLPVLASAALISVNWLVFVYAVQTDRVLATSLGYYVNPLISVLLGTLFLGERLRPVQLLAVAIAGAGVLQLTVAFGSFPWIAGALATSFALYGLVRKVAPVPPLAGFAVEMLLIAPAGLAYLAVQSSLGAAAFPTGDARLDGLVLCAGAVTAAPLLLFATAAKRLRLSTLGLVQYLAPTLAFALAVGLYGEPFTRAHAVTFFCVWLALGLYSLDAARAMRPAEAAPEPVPAAGGGR